MATYTIAANMEFVRSADLGIEAGVRVAAELGCIHVEPMVHTGWELLGVVSYLHLIGARSTRTRLPPRSSSTTPDAELGHAASAGCH